MNNSNPNILIVDDNQNNLYTLHMLLTEHLEVNIIEATSGFSALEVLIEKHVDLIILDVQMPEMDGFETAKLIQSRRTQAHIPIVFLSAAYKSDDFKQQGLDAGAVDYLTKPIDAPRLISRVRSYLRFIEQERIHNAELKKHTEALYESNKLLHLEINERQQAETALQKISQRNQLILETADEGIFGLDLKETITFINKSAAQMLGYKSEQLLGCRFHAVAHYAKPDGTPFHGKECRIHEVMFSGENFHATDEVFWRYDGRPLPVEYRVSPLVDNEEITGCVVTFNDITERRQAELMLLKGKEEAEQASLAKSRFLANMSHELRTPLNAVIGYSEILQEEAEDEGINEFLPDLNKIRSAGKHLLGLINDVLDISKIEAGKMEIELHNIDLHIFLEELVSTAEPLVSKKNNKLIIDMTKKQLEIISDSTKLRQILLNLLSNAAKFTKGGDIRLQATQKYIQGRQWVAFAVQDTGIGMNEEQKLRIFDAFTQADTSTTRKYGGTGLGLAISKKFATMMGGSLTVESQLGEGSCFTLLLPLDGENKDQFFVSDTTEHHDKNTLVLLLCENTNRHEQINSFLQRQGYIVATEQDSEKAYNLALKIQPDIILLDISIIEKPRHLLELFKNHYLLENIPMVFVTLPEQHDQVLNELKPSPFYTDSMISMLSHPVQPPLLLKSLEKYQLKEGIEPMVLIVEDNHETRQLFSLYFMQHNWRVLNATNGHQALEQLNDRQPQLIILDLLMPEIDGFELLTRIRKNQTWFDIPVIIVTAHKPEKEIMIRLQGQVDSVINKGDPAMIDLIMERSKQIQRDFNANNLSVSPLKSLS